MIQHITEKAWHIVIAGFIGILIGSFSTATAFTAAQFEYANAEEGEWQPFSPPTNESHGSPPGEQFSPPPSESERPPSGSSNPSTFRGQFDQKKDAPPEGTKPNFGEQPPFHSEGSGGNGQQEFQGQPSGSQGQPNGQEGPSEEDVQKEEARRKEQEAKNVERMKKSMQRMKKEVANVKKKFEKQASKGVGIPEQCTEAIGKAETIFVAVDGATTMEELEDAGTDELKEHFDTLNDCNHTVDRLAQIPKILKRVDRDIKNLERNWNRAKKGAPSDAGEAVADGDTALRNIKNARARLNDIAKLGDLDEFETVLEDDVMGKFDDVNAASRRLEAAKNAKRFMSQFTGHIKKAEAMIAKMKKQKKDTGEMEDVLSEMKEQYATAKQLKPGTEEYEDAVDALAELGQDFAAAAGAEDDVDAEIERGIGKGSASPKLIVPEGF